MHLYVRGVCVCVCVYVCVGRHRNTVTCVLFMLVFDNFNPPAHSTDLFRVHSYI